NSQNLNEKDANSSTAHTWSNQIEKTIITENRLYPKKACKEKILDTQQHIHTSVRIDDSNVKIDIKGGDELNQDLYKEDIRET
ncbi:4568_t:CDS:1, partial [Acaulospora colombiana]